MKRTFAAVSFVLAGTAFASAQDWPQFRGPEGQGHSTVEKLPMKWSGTSKNITWKTPIDGLGWSSPVVADGRIWLTTATNGGRSLRAISLDLKTGKKLVDKEVVRRGSAGRIHKKNSHASPTPILDGDRVYVHFGTYGTACLTREGKMVWRQELRYKHVHGPGGSPALHGNLLIISCDGGNEQFVVGLDRATGRVRWKTPRPKAQYAKKFAFSTPLVIDVAGKKQVVSPAANSVTSYDPASGRPIWTAMYEGGYSVVPRPVYGHGMVFIGTGYDRPTLIAVRVDGRGDVTRSHVAWKLTKNAPHNPSPLLVGDELYIVSDRGVATCLDAKTGEERWQERLGGDFSASPLYAAGRIYFQSEGGETTVLKPGTTFEELARNKVAGRTFASLTPIEGALLLRTETHLLRIEAD